MGIAFGMVHNFSPTHTHTDPQIPRGKKSLTTEDWVAHLSILEILKKEFYIKLRRLKFSTDSYDSDSKTVCEAQHIPTIKLHPG